MPDAPSAPPAEFVKQVHDALRDWHKFTDTHPWQSLHLWRRIPHSAPSVRQHVNEILKDGLSALEQSWPQEIAILRQRFVEGYKTFVVSKNMSQAEGTIFRKQKNGIQNLSNFLWRQEQEEIQALQARLLERLPTPTYSRLFGIDDHCNVLAEELARPGPPWILSIEAIGGMGKTALADAVCRHLIHNLQVEQVGWVTARQTGLNLLGQVQREERPALTPSELVDRLASQLLAEDSDYRILSQEEKQGRLTQRLGAEAHLIVVDNLETLTDANALLSHLRNWANPTKFLLTTRYSPHAEADVFHFQLTELSPKDALSLLRHEATLRNLPSVAQATNAQLMPVVDAVGGNPLALRLVVGQLHVHGLTDVLADLAAAQSTAITNLYTHIYRQAWDDLNETEQRLLLAMPLVPEDGQPLAEIGLICGLPQDALRDSIGRLVRRNLIDVQDDIHEPRYAIHSLTRTFLREQVLKW